MTPALATPATMAAQSAAVATIVSQSAPAASIAATTTVVLISPAIYNLAVTYDYPQTGYNATQFAPGSPTMIPA